MTTPPYIGEPGNSAADVRRWYAAKTRWLLDKYGPGPAIHFHTGLVSADVVPADSAEQLSRQLVEGQERMLRQAGAAWGAASIFRREVLDVGCGLGGSALWFARELGCHVTALTNVPEHVPWIQRFVAAAGLAGRVTCELADAHEVGGAGRFDAAYCIDASNYFDRRRWFQALARVLRPGGHVAVEDTFHRDAAAAQRFNAYWLSRVGTREQYVEAAGAAGFEWVRSEDVSDDAARWYDLSVAHSRAWVRERGLTGEGLAARERSMAWQAEFADGLRARRFEDLLLLFRLR